MKTSSSGDQLLLQMCRECCHNLATSSHVLFVLESPFYYFFLSYEEREREREIEGAGGGRAGRDKHSLLCHPFSARASVCSVRIFILSPS